MEMFDANKYIHFVFGYSAVVLFIDAHDELEYTFLVCCTFSRRGDSKHHSLIIRRHLINYII